MLDELLGERDNAVAPRRVGELHQSANRRGRRFELGRRGFGARCVLHVTLELAVVRDPAAVDPREEPDDGFERELGGALGDRAAEEAAEPRHEMVQAAPEHVVEGEEAAERPLAVDCMPVAGL